MNEFSLRKASCTLNHDLLCTANVTLFCTSLVALGIARAKVQACSHRATWTTMRWWSWTCWRWGWLWTSRRRRWGQCRCWRGCGCTFRWLRTMMYLAQNPQVRYRKRRGTEITSTWASLARNPAHPLRGFNGRTSTVHRILHNFFIPGTDVFFVIVWVKRLAIQVGQPLPIFCPGRLHVERAARKISIVGTSTSIATASTHPRSRMPSGSELTITIVFRDVEL